MSSPIIPQSLFLDAAITGTTAVTLDRTALTRAKLTNTVATGSAKATLNYGMARSDPRKWAWGLRAMDRIAVAGWASGRADDPSRVPMWSGYLDAVTVTEDTQAGFAVKLDASTVWKALEVTTETPGQFDVRVSWQGLPASDLVTIAALTAGVPIDTLPGVDPVTDLYSLQSTDASVSVSPVYQDWATIAAAASTMVGLELFANESGRLQYRQSQYDQPPAGTIPAERIISASMALDTDAGIVNQVMVRWGPQQSLTKFQQATSGPPANYDTNHYRNRVLIIGAPWIADDPGSTGQQQAQWYADWALSWAFHNSRTAVVSLAFWPQVRVGAVYTLPWPAGTLTNFYVASVVHDIQVGGPAVTTLGLTYGRPLNVKWFSQLPPAGFGQYGAIANQRAAVQASTGQAGGSPHQLPTGANWRTTFYTPAGRATRTDANGIYLTTRYGAKLYPHGWQPPQALSLLSYDMLRPCAFDPAYAVPELGGQALSAGDTLRLQDGTIAQCWDTGSAVTGRHLDIFFPQTPATPPADFQSVTFMNVSGLNLQSMPSQVPFGSSPTPPVVAPGGVRARVVQLAEAEIGHPYVWGGASENGFDCSGLTQWVYRAVGISLPHNAQAQYEATTRIAVSNLLPGDLVFLANTDPSDPTGPAQHVGLFVGDDKIVDANGARLADGTLAPVQYDSLTAWAAMNGPNGSYGGAGRVIGVGN